MFHYLTHASFDGYKLHRQRYKPIPKHDSVN